ncbi:hypothetical protein ABK040_004849 [Willaertia magna]
MWLEILGQKNKLEDDENQDAVMKESKPKKKENKKKKKKEENSDDDYGGVRTRSQRKKKQVKEQDDNEEQDETNYVKFIYNIDDEDESDYEKKKKKKKSPKKKKNKTDDSEEETKNNNEEEENIELSDKICIQCKNPLRCGQLCIAINPPCYLGLEDIIPYHPHKNRCYKPSYLREIQYLHMNCYHPTIHRPYQVMFSPEIDSLELDDDELMDIYSNICSWQTKYRTLTKKKRDFDSKYFKDDEKEEGKKSSTPTKKKKKKRKVFDDEDEELLIANYGDSEEEEEEEKEEEEITPKRKRRTKGSPVKEVELFHSNDFLQPTANTTMNNTNSSPYLLSLADEIWSEILSYLPFDCLLKIESVCKAFHYYIGTDNNLLWKMLCERDLTPKAKEIQTKCFPLLENDFKLMYKLLYGNCCVECGKYIRGGLQILDEVKTRKTKKSSSSTSTSTNNNNINFKSLMESRGSILLEHDPFYYCFSIDNVLCEKCRESDKYQLISKTSLKKGYWIDDDELSKLRCLKSPNPWRRSKPMFKYSLLQIEHLQQSKLEQLLLDRLLEKKKWSVDKLKLFFNQVKKGKHGTSNILYDFLTKGNKDSKGKIKMVALEAETLLEG